MQHGRFITTAIAAVAAMAIGPAGAVAAPSSFVDDSAADFGAGAPGAGTVVQPAGSVQLNRSLVAEGFNGGPGLPAGFTATHWDPMAPGTSTVGSGVLTVQGDRVNAAATSGPGQVLEFTAAFSGKGSQHIGFGDVANGPWAIFSTGGGNNLSARTLATAGGTESTPTLIPGFDVPGVVQAMHTYRIEWFTDHVNFWVDGVQRASHMVTIAGPQPAVVSDPTAGSGAVTVDSLGWMRFPASASFESRTFDAGAAGAVWSTVTPTAVTTGAATVVIATRTGPTPAFDGSWSSYQPLGSGGAVQSPAGRYIQYQATLGTTDDQVTPSLDKVQLDYDVPAAAGGTQSGGSTATGSGSGGTQGGGSSALDTTAPKVSLAAKSLRASKSGTVSFRVKCPATETSCKITLKLKNGGKSAASKTVTVKGGKTVTLTLKLSKTTRALLKHGSLKVSAVMTATDAAGNRKTTTRKLTLRRPA
jgi:hypothetical protein